MIRGSSGEDRLDGGPGRDELFGFARDDTFLTPSRDDADTMHGGTGIEALPEGFALLAGELEGREVQVGIGCPRDHARGCAGSFWLVRGGRLLASRGFSLRTGATKGYTLRLPASTARTVSRRGRLVVRFVALSRDGLGRRIRLSVPFTLYETLPTLS